MLWTASLASEAEIKVQGVKGSSPAFISVMGGVGIDRGAVSSRVLNDGSPEKLSYACGMPQNGCKF